MKRFELRSVLAGLLLIGLFLAGCTMVVDPAGQASSGAAPIEPQAAEWGTWVLTSSDEVRPSPPPDSAASATEIAQLKELAAQRDAAAEESVAYWDAGAPGYRWIELALERYSAGPPNPGVSRGLALLNVAIYDATIATWDAKYAYNRPAPSQVDPTISPALDLPRSPSYPSEHAATAGAAAAVLSYLFPQDADLFAQLADEAAQSRLLAGVNYPSDTEAGLALGQAVGDKVIEWAMTDGSDAVWDGDRPTGPGIWNGETPVFPLAGTWRTWVLSSGDQLLPPPPAAYDSVDVEAQLTELKSITRTFPIAQQAMYWHTFESAYPYWYDWATMRLFEHKLDHNTPHAALVYSALGVAFHDAIVACFGAKYTYWYIRPSQLDAELAPLFPPPPHPSYPAAHGCASNAAATTLAAFFPSEADEILTTAQAAANTRVSAGIHYPMDVEAGLTLGRDAATLVVKRVEEMAQPQP